jgi:hypothetical protein
MRICETLNSSISTKSIACFYEFHTALVVL